MQITLSTFGTLGDLLPYLALGRALQARGHQVVMAIPGGLLPYARRDGLDAVPCYPHEGPDQMKVLASGFDHWPADLASALQEDEVQVAAKAEAQQLRWKERFDLKTRVQDLVAACKNADLLVCHSLLTGEPVSAEIAGIPCVHAQVAPERLWQRWLQKFIAELREILPTSAASRIYLDHLQNERLRRGLPERPSSGWHGYFHSSPTLLAASPRFLAPLDTSSWNAEVCGFWFYDDPAGTAWEPDPELAAFVARGPAPLVLSFSSLPLTEPDRVLALHIEAARQLSRPLVVLTGWSGMPESAGSVSDVLFRNFLPCDWLFSRAAALIHHGGIGTTARGLRNACPMLVEPWGNDQFFNAMLILKNAVGAAVNPKKLTAAAVAHFIETRVLSQQTVERAKALAAEIGREDGLREAVRLIESAASAKALDLPSFPRAVA